MEYSAVIQPPVTLCSFIQRGTFSSIIMPQITRVLPHSMSVEPVACGAMLSWNRSGRNWFGCRPSARKAGAAGVGSAIIRGHVNRHSRDGNEEVGADSVGAKVLSKESVSGE